MERTRWLVGRGARWTGVLRPLLPRHISTLSHRPHTNHLIRWRKGPCGEQSGPWGPAGVVVALRHKHGGQGSGKDDISHLFVPVPFKVRQDEINIGEEITGPLKKRDIGNVLQKFFGSEDIKALARENGLDKYLYQQTYMSFRRFCLESDSLPDDLHIIISDIMQGAGHINDIYPSFLKHAKSIFPHLVCMEDLYKISDLSFPPKWYPEARSLNRKIIFHAGPTNSGKTFHAMEHFLNADSGIYCGPLRLLASEVFSKSNAKGTPCDLVTGEERRLGNTDGTSANHVACTIEMASVNTPYEVAVIDEVQMLRDPGRGWAWTRALLGIPAKEVHVCGEAAAIALVSELAAAAGEEVEVRRYNRLTKLTVEGTAVQTIDNVGPGDCIVCFNKRDIHWVTRKIEQQGQQVAVIYGGLPPGTKLAQAEKFNDPSHPCKILVATDAIGMGLNLSIRRIIFYSLIRPNINEKGEMEMETLSVSLALQIAGRAGRYGTQWPHGYVTTMKAEDLPTLKGLLVQTPEEISQAGLHPTPDQIELFAFHLPNYTLSNLIDVFINLCTVDSSLYFMCLMEDFKFLADLIQHVPLPLRARYIFCCAPISRKMPFVCALMLKFVRQYSENEPASMEWLCQQVKWPFPPPGNLMDLLHLEQVYDVCDLYLWLSYRFPDIFHEPEMVRDLQRELDGLIETGVTELIRLIRNSSSSTSNLAANTEDTFIMDHKKKRSKKTNVADMQERETLLRNIEREAKRSLSSGRGKKKGGRGVRPGKLTERLLAQGLLSPQMLAELQKEWLQGKSGDDDDRS